MNTPKGWKQTKVSDLLTLDQLKYVRDLLGNNDTDYNKTVRLKNYLAGLGPKLLAKDVVPDYLAYLLIYLHNEGKI